MTVEIVREDDPRCGELEAATHHVVPPVAELAERWVTGRVFGALDGERLVGAELCAAS